MCWTRSRWISSPSRRKYEVKFKIVEWWEGLTHQIGEWFGGGGESSSQPDTSEIAGF